MNINTDNREKINVQESVTQLLKKILGMNPPNGAKKVIHDD